MQYYTTNNSSKSIPVASIPIVDYAEFYTDITERLTDSNYHIGEYFATIEGDHLRLFCLLLNDQASSVEITSFIIDYYCEESLPSLTALHPQVHLFEREISELYGIKFDKMPWNKPLRFAHNRSNKDNSMDNYPFYKMNGESLHEVSVGPIHAGIIEPGAFRFICNGEEVLHLEIALGYQHRGVEGMFTSTQNRLRQSLLSESIAGDSAIAHSTAFTEVVERLSNSNNEKNNIDTERFIALELERIALHIADTGGLSTDIGYQLGQVACEALRTVVINTTQGWCGNRFGKGLIRPFGTNYPLTTEKIELIKTNITDVRRRYNEVVEDITSSPSILSRFEQCGVVPYSEMLTIGGVGFPARASGLKRDIRNSHPWGEFLTMESPHNSIVMSQGDVMSRLLVRCGEVIESIDYILERLDNFTPKASAKPNFDSMLSADSLSFAFIEGWRGEICHVAITDERGDISTYKIKDPSTHNWLGLALAVRSEGISDFPICNKSFNLSYCGNDL